jgi:glucokinase
MNHSRSTAIGIDIGGTNTKIGLIHRTGKILGFQSFPSETKGDDPSNFLRRVEDNIWQILEKAEETPLGIGFSVHGYLTSDGKGPLICYNTPALMGFNLHDWARQRFGYPVIINNDLIAHTLAEYTFGSGRGARRFMSLAIGTGLGAGVIIDGKPLRIIGGTTGDPGRVILDPAGPECVYGVKGSAEALCGVPHIERLASERYGYPVYANEVISAARRGDDPIAVEVIQQIGSYLGLWLASLCALFLPDRVALTGGTAEAGSILLEACQKRFEEAAGKYHQILASWAGDYYRGVEIVLGEKRYETGVLGAVVELFQG